MKLKQESHVRSQAPQEPFDDQQCLHQQRFYVKLTFSYGNPEKP